MKVEFYKTTDNLKTVNKTLTLNKTVDIVFRQSVDEQAPVIIMSIDNLQDANYVYIPTFKRYYFISDVSNLTANLVKLQLTTDLLMTYKDVILNTLVQITATEKPSYLSSSLPTLTTTEQDKYTSDVTIPNTNSIILTTIGG